MTKTSFVRYINNPKEIKNIRKDYYPYLVEGFGSDQLLVEASISEAVVNAWRHGHEESDDRSIRVEVNFLHSRMVVRITDQGEGFDWQKYQCHNDMRHWFPCMEELEEPGRGIILLLRVMDSLRYNKKGNECLLMKKYQNQG
ncbi:ATP-binding protein [Halobacillus litoralis]|uniref:ATP-binding protein n=1 Tax=Halobacillus litoralis TaxID=45668 RepID=UPI001CD5580D|nr:ATP-binding protein [Halobacillus litoralis]MCA0969752.1 ATP-binding protein [Halobacillus litoralis]